MNDKQKNEYLKKKRRKKLQYLLRNIWMKTATIEIRLFIQLQFGFRYSLQIKKKLRWIGIQTKICHVGFLLVSAFLNQIFPEIFNSIRKHSKWLKHFRNEFCVCWTKEWRGKRMKYLVLKYLTTRLFVLLLFLNQYQRVA